MSRIATIFLQGVIILIGIGALAFLLWEPHVEGRNINATLFQIYFKDPFLAFVYAGSIPFFVALFQGLKLIQFVGDNRVIAIPAIKAVQTIRYCALVLICFIAIAEVIILFNDSDDRAGGVMIGVALTFGSSIVAAASYLFEGSLKNALKSCES